MLGADRGGARDACHYTKVGVTGYSNYADWEAGQMRRPVCANQDKTTERRHSVRQRRTRSVPRIENAIFALRAQADKNVCAPANRDTPAGAQRRVIDFL
jgi:hypothetical protein